MTIYLKQSAQVELLGHIVAVQTVNDQTDFVVFSKTH